MLIWAAPTAGDDNRNGGVFVKLIFNFLEYRRQPADRGRAIAVSGAQRSGASEMGITAIIRSAFLALCAATLSSPATAQDNAAQEAAHRQAMLARLPADAAKRVFGLMTTPSAGPP